MNKIITIFTMVNCKNLQSSPNTTHTHTDEEITDISIISSFWLLKKTLLLDFKHLYFSRYTGIQASVFRLSELSLVNTLRLKCQFLK